MPKINIKKGKIPKVASLQADVSNTFVATYPPIKCGIATFTKDLTSALNMLNPNQLSKIIAITPTNEEPNYPWEVAYQVDQDNHQAYIEVADYVNSNNTDVVCIQHEYGIFGGKNGEDIVSFAKNIKPPLIMTLHTVIETPNENQKKIIKDLSDICKVVVVMSQVPKKRLASIYGVEPGKIVIIPHGIPDIPFTKPDLWKDLLGLEGKFVVGSFGLLGPNKGYEYLIKAMSKVVEKHPNAVGLIAGETHPKVKAQYGEKYREELVNLAKKIGIEKSIHFLNKYLSLQELVYVIQAMDIYVAPYTNPQQISSGALSYAIGCGRACVATPFAYAKEILREGRGMIVPFENPQKLAHAICKLIVDPEEREKIAHCAYLQGRRMTWVRVADGYLDIFRFLKTVYGKRGKRSFKPN